MVFNGPLMVNIDTVYMQISDTNIFPFLSNTLAWQISHHAHSRFYSWVQWWKNIRLWYFFFSKIFKFIPLENNTEVFNFPIPIFRWRGKTRKTIRKQWSSGKGSTENIRYDNNWKTKYDFRNNPAIWKIYNERCPK